NPARCRCLECFDAQYLCIRCMLQSHRQVPLHQILHWENGQSSRVGLKSIGMCIPLGHPSCEMRLSEPHFIIMDTDRPHDVAIDFCGCGVAGSPSGQLVAARLYPATYERPRAAISFRMV
ncbi:hypothetical protein C8F04DRAFT_884063, partial [Mycena alexandri]